MVETARVTLLTVIAVTELEERLVRDLKALGVRGYTIDRVEARGAHGHRMAGLVDATDLRFEMFVSTAVAHRVLERIAKSYAEQPIMAYLHEVEAMPAEHFADGKH
jgi:Fic family protein